MIISYLHNFIFIKTKKTAGTSMEVALATHAGPDDVVTPFGPREERERFKLYPESPPQNFGKDKEGEARFIAAWKTGNRKSIRAVVDQIATPNLVVQRHGSARRAKQLVGDGFWNSAFKFTIERHPYEKAVSLAWFGRKGREFSEALDEVVQGDVYRNFPLYTIDGRLAVDFVVRYEHMEEDLEKVEHAIGGLPVRARLPRANAKQRSDRRPAIEVLSDGQKAIVYDKCREEFELMGYEP